MKTSAIARAMLAFAGFTLASSEAQSPLDVRVALVIGNTAYQHASVLPNATKDAEGIATALKTLGFKVEHVRDGDRAQMEAALARVRQSLDRRNGLAMLYYAGHGLQVSWHNYMVPVDLRLTTSTDLAKGALDVGTVLRSFAGTGTRMNIIVLDACRENPFPAAALNARGLAPMEAPLGTFLAYATQPGALAEDGDPQQPFGPYADALILELGRPGSRVEDVFKRVRYHVRRKTEGRQIPWDATTLEEDFVFNDGKGVKLDPKSVEIMIAEARKREQQLREEAERAKQRERELAEAAARARREAEQAAQRKLEEEAALARQREQERQAAERAERARVLAEAEAARRKLDEEVALAALRERERVAAERAEQARREAVAEAARRQREEQIAIAAQRERERQAAAAAERARNEAEAAEARRRRESEATIAAQRDRERLAAIQAETTAAAQRERERIAAAQADRERLAAEAAEAQRRRDAEVAAAAQRDRERLTAERVERERLEAQAANRRRELDELARREAAAREREAQIARARVEEEARKKRLDEELATVQAAARQQEQVREELAAQAALQNASAQQKRDEYFRIEKQKWDRLRDSRDPQPLYDYLLAHPSGGISELAQARLEVIQPAKITPQADQTGLVQPLAAKRFRLGDQYVFQVSDLLTRLQMERPTFTVTRATEEEAEFNQGYRVTQAGAIIRTIGGATLDPYQQWIPSGEYSVGRKWYTRSIMRMPDGSTQWVELNGKVLARENIQVPAGRFDTFKMEMEQVAQDGTRLKITYWGQPDWGVAIKQIREIRDTRGALSGQVFELVSRARR